MQLHHNTMMAQSRFIRLCLNEYGCNSDLVEEKPWERDTAVMKLSPMGTLPVLIDENEHKIIGYYPILEYLDETRGVMMRSNRMMPESPLDRAEVRQLVDWFIQQFDSDIVRPLVRERVFKLEMMTQQGDMSPDTNILRNARANIRQHMVYFEWLTKERNWIAGARLTAADLAASACLSIIDYLGEIEWSKYPQSHDWYQRIKSRPSFRPLLEDRVRALQPSSHYADLDF